MNEAARKWLAPFAGEEPVVAESESQRNAGLKADLAAETDRRLDAEIQRDRALREVSQLKSQIKALEKELGLGDLPGGFTETAAEKWLEDSSESQ